MTQREYKGSAAAAVLSGTLASGTGVGGTFTLTADPGASWPSGASYNFVVCIGRGTANEEKILCSARSAAVLTITSRGFDGGSAITHSNGEAVEHVLDAATITEANAHVNDVTRDDHTQYLNTTRHDVTARHLVGTSIPAATPGNSAVGDAAAAGSSTSVARADHVHGREAFGTTAGTSAVADTQSGGSATTASKSDHRHAREAFGSPVSVSSANSDGVATTVARSDHQHTDPVRARVTQASGSWTSSPPSASTGPWLDKDGHTSGTTDASGDLTVTFSTQFPGGLLRVLPAMSSWYNIGAYCTLVDTPAPTASSFTVRIWRETGVVLASTPVTIDWNARGW